MTTTLKLYSTSSCHLCEEATAILLSVGSNDFTWEEIEISDDDALIDRYGTRIPVLLNCRSGQELNWPFNRQDIVSLISTIRP